MADGALYRVTRGSPHPESQGTKPTLLLNLSEGVQKQRMVTSRLKKMPPYSEDPVPGFPPHQVTPAVCLHHRWRKVSRVR